MWPIAKEEPLGIVPDVQPEGSYFLNGAQMTPYHNKVFSLIKKLFEFYFEII